MLSIPQLYEHFLECTGIQTDHRTVQVGNLFIALRGEKFDGNQFAAAALENGAKYAIVDNPSVLADDERYLVVENSLEALQQLAKHHREQLSNVRVLAITGSNGKTTTKELVARVLATTFRTQATVGNLNNHIGVPLTLLRMPTDVEVAVIEMGANHIGEIAALCEIAQPQVGLITNIGKAHLEGFGNLAGVQRAKGELFDYLNKQNGLALVNIGDARVKQVAKQMKRRLTYGHENPAADLWSQENDTDKHIGFICHKRAKTFKLTTQLVGAYNRDNVLAAAAAGIHFGVPTPSIQSAIADYLPTNQRSQQVEQGSNLFILDCYNANPGSMQAALAHLKQLYGKQKIVLLGDMLELGSESVTEHQRVIEQLIRIQPATTVLVGDLFSKTDTQALSNVWHFADAVAARQWWQAQTFSDSVILVKGSRGMRLEEVVSVQ